MDITPRLDTSRASTHEVTSNTSDIQSVQFQALGLKGLENRLKDLERGGALVTNFYFLGFRLVNSSYALFKKSSSSTQVKER